MRSAPPGFNELAGSLLDALRALAPAVAAQQQGTPLETLARLLRCLCVLLQFGRAPLRLQTSAAAVLGALAAAAASVPGPLAAAVARAVGEQPSVWCYVPLK